MHEQNSASVQPYVQAEATAGVAPTAEAKPQEPVAWGVIGADGKLLLAEKRTLLAYFDNPPRPLVWGDVGVPEGDRG